MRHVAWAAVAALSLSWLLTACSQDASSSANAPAIVTSGPTAVSPPTDPSPILEQQTPAEFVLEWVADYNEMQTSGKTGRFRSLSRRCQACRSAADRIDAIYDGGGFVETDGWTVESMKISRPNHSGQRVVTAEVTSAPTRFSESKGGAVQTFDGGTVTARLSLAPTGYRWNVFEIEQVAR